MKDSRVEHENLVSGVKNLALGSHSNTPIVSYYKIRNSLKATEYTFGLLANKLFIEDRQTSLGVFPSHIIDIYVHIYN